MNPVEVPRRGWALDALPVRGQGGFSIPNGFPVGNTPGMSAPIANPAGLAPVEAQPATQDAVPPFQLPDVLKAYVFNKTEFGFFTAIRGVIGLADFLVLPQPDTKRIYLLIVNPSPTANLFVQFGQVATAVNAFQIPPVFGSLLFDARVPQDDIHIVGDDAATQFQLIYSNHGEF